MESTIVHCQKEYKNFVKLLGSIFEQFLYKLHVNCSLGF